MPPPGEGGRRLGRGEEWRGPTRFQVAVVVGLLLLTFFAARTCQQSQIRVDKDEAIATAEQEVDFAPSSTQVRFLRQGISRQPFWFVSLGVPLEGDEEGFSKLAIVKVDANTGEVVEVKQESEPPPAGKKATGSKGRKAP